MRNLFLVISLFFCSLQVFGQKSVSIKTEATVMPSEYEDVTLTYSTRSLVGMMGFDPMHLGSFGVSTLSGGKIFKRNITLVDTMGQQNLSIAQAFQRHPDGTYSVWNAGGNGIGFYLLDENMNIEVNLYDYGVYPDVHGITKDSDGNVIYFSNAIQQESFYNPSLGILDTTIYQALGHDIKIFDPTTGAVTTIFDWFQSIPLTMIIPEYLYEGDQGPGVIDWGHPNSINIDWDGNIIVSWRHLGVCKVNIETGEIIWWAGLPEGVASANGFNELVCVGGDCRTRLQHSFHPIAGSPGEYTIFDNGDFARDSSRALFVSIDEANSTISVAKNFWFPKSDFMGSVDVRNDGVILVNVPVLGTLPMEKTPLWAQNGVLQDSVAPHLPTMGSRIYLMSPEGEILTESYTDSANYIYQVQFFDFDDWPAIECDEDQMVLDQSVQNPIWINSEDSLPGDYLESDGDTYQVSFDFGITTGYTKRFDSNNCLETSIESIGNEDITIYPNPTASFFSLRNYEGNVHIIDMSGRLLEAAYYKTHQKISTEGLVSGMYILKLENGLRKKILIQ